MVYHIVYTMPLGTVFLLAFSVLAFWFSLEILIGEKSPRKWKYFHAALLVVWLAVVLNTTLFSRGYRVQEVHLIPFFQLYKFLVKGEEDAFRSFFMNIILFIPGGLALSNCLPDKAEHRGRERISHALRRTLFTTGAGFVLSLAIELIQGILHLGQFEMDDLITNTLGTFIGCFSYLFAAFLMGWQEEPPTDGIVGKLWEKGNQHAEIMSYIYWGGMTTLVNWDTFFVLEKVLNILVANTIAWIVSVLFAFVTNRLFVFQSEAKGMAVVKEGILFAAGRLFALGVELALLWLGVDVLALPTALVKFITGIVNAVLNYIIGKLLVFRKTDSRPS